MERVELLQRAAGRPIAAGYVQTAVGSTDYRIYPAAGSRAKWIGRLQHVRFGDGREVALMVSEHRTRQVKWLIGRERKRLAAEQSQ